jgi:hypothetical protein
MYVVTNHSFIHSLTGWQKSNVIQPHIMSRICSFISVNEETKNEKLFCVEEPWLEFNPSHPSIISILDENITFFRNLVSYDVAGSRLQSVARQFSTNIQLIPCLQQLLVVSTNKCCFRIMIVLNTLRSTKRLTQNQHIHTLYLPCN